MALLCLLAMPASAQVQNGIFTGTVSDPQGASVAGADVAVVNLGTNYTITVKTGSEGLYRAAEMPVGNYKITVAAAGFKTAVKTSLYLGAGVIARVDFTLEIGQKTETITVEAGALQVQTDDSRLYETIGAGQVANLPLNGRNVFDLIQLAPGAVNVDGVSFENGHDTVVNGLRPNFNGFLINGVSDKGLSGGEITVPNADIVQEFQELTLNMSAQYGNSAAAIVNVVTKSGGNTFHGSAYEFLRNDALDANDFFRNANNTGSSDPGENPALQPSKVRFNQFGGVLTGPIIKDKLFFTASYQGDRFVTQADPTPVLAESPQWRAAVAAFRPNSVAALIYGNFPTLSAGTPSLTLTDYVTGAAGGSGSGFPSFAAYMCPDNYPNAGFTGLATQFQSLFGVQAGDDFSTAVPDADGDFTQPCSVTPGIQAGAISRTIPFLNDNVLLFGSQLDGNLFNGNEWSTRIDWVRKNDRIFGEYYWVHTTDSFGPGNASSGIHGFRNPTKQAFPNFQASWVHTFSPNWLNEARAGYVLARLDQTVAVPGVPSIGFDDLTAGFGSYNGYPQFFHENIYSYGDMMSFQKGKHNLKAGVDFRRNIENSEFNIARPSYYFFDQLFFAMDAPYGMAAGTDPGFITNRPAELADNFRHWRNLEIGAYFQDDWKVRRNLTINMGLRFDLYTRHTEKEGKVTTFIPGPGCQVVGNGYCVDGILNANIPAGDPGCDTPEQLARNVLAGVCGPGGFAIVDNLGGADHNNFGPRVGFSWDPWSNGKTAIRGGFGVSYEGTLFNPLSNSRWNPPFYSFNGVQNALAGDVSSIVYGPTAANANGTANCNPTTTACTPSGVAPTFEGSTVNPGAGVGVQATGNINGWFAGNPNFAILTGIVFPEGIRDPYVLNYYFGVQREVLPKTVLEVNYVGTRGYKLFRAEQGNRAPGIRMAGFVPAVPAQPGPDGIFGTPDDIPAVAAVPAQTAVDTLGRTLTGLGRRFLNPNYGNLRIWSNVSRSWYNSLQVAVRHQATRGFTFNAAYAWSHAVDTGSGWHSGTTTANGGAAGDAYSLDPTASFLDRGNSTFDIRHRLTFNYVYELPWHKDQKGVIGHVLGGWQYQGLWAFQSGAHMTPYCATGNACDFNFDGTRNDRPDAPNGSSLDVSRDQWANGWFNVSGSSFGCGWNAAGAAAGVCGGPGTPGALLDAFFTTPCRACAGNLGRNTFEGPGIFNTDQSLFKNIRLTERFNLQFRFEVFNAFNRANFKLPSSATGANFANRITSGIFGKSAGTLGPRHIQFGLKILF